MKISTRGRYAVRMMLDIAMHDEAGEPVRIKDIAERQNLSIKYLESIVSALTKAGYLKSIRGPQGGYRLMKRPEEYTVGDILRITEGSLAPVACLDDEVNQCERADSCVTLRLWSELNAAIRGVVDKYTLADLKEWQSADSDNYVI